MRFFPISYHQTDSNRGVDIIIFAYNEHEERIAIRMKYTYWFYASLENHTFKEVNEIISTLSGAFVEEESIDMRYSTVKLHKKIKSVRIHAYTKKAKYDAINILGNNQINIHEYDDTLGPLIKLMAQRDVKKYQWLEIDTDNAVNKLTISQSEYIGKVPTLIASKGEYPPPEFSILSGDGEMESDNWNRMPDAMAGDINAIRVWGFTYKYKDIYQEHAIVLGPDVTPIFDRLGKSDINDGIVQIHTVSTEIQLIEKYFDLIKVLNPDILTGHNILGFDIPYILSRWKYLIMARCKDKDYNGPDNIDIPNVSRLVSYSVPINNVSWHNNQVAITGSYYNCPGRIWIDLLVVAGRGLLGGTKNNKLETLGECILGMSKDNVHHIDMFRGFKLYRDWDVCKRIDNGSVQASDVPFTGKIVSSEIRKAYEMAISKHNKIIPRKVLNPTIDHINTMVRMLNMINQRGRKIRLIASKDIPNTQEGKLILLEKYTLYRSQLIESIKKWNIPVEEVGSINEDTMIQIIWWSITMYCIQDTRIPYQIMEQQGLSLILREQSSVFSVDISEVLLRGQVYTVTNSQYRYNYQRGFMMDFGQRGGPTGAYSYGGGYVGKGVPGLKIVDNDSVIFVLDFASLYPTIIIAYNICYTTWIPYNMRDAYLPDGILNKEYIWLHYQDDIPIKKATYLDELLGYLPLYNGESAKEIAKDHPHKDRIDTLIEYIETLDSVLNASYEDKGRLMCSVHDVPNKEDNIIRNHWFIKASILAGVVPGMLWEQYMARVSIKKKMGLAYKSGDKAMGDAYNAQQLATKTSMNSTYGGYGTENNRLAIFPGADLVTYLGRDGITNGCNKEIERRGVDTVIYNDTDSAMIRIDGITAKFDRDPKKIQAYGINMAKELSSLFPKPMSLECENFFMAFFLKAPKMYAGIKWDSKSVDIKDYTWEYVNAMNLLYIKGMAPVRKDKYQANKDLLIRILYNTLIRSNWSILVQYLENALIQLWSLSKGIHKGDRTDEQWKLYLSNIERLFAYNMGISTKAISGAGTMAKWCNIYKDKYGKKPVVGERFELLVTNVSSGPDKDKHTKSSTKLVTMDWLQEEKRQLDIEHYILSLEKDGNVVQIMNIAYPEIIARDCVTKYYLRNLRHYNSLHGKSA